MAHSTTIPKTYYLGAEITDKAWHYWNRHNPGVYESYYRYVSRKSTNAKRFEDFLWEHGAIIRQVNYKRCLEFTDEHDALAFRLKIA